MGQCSPNPANQIIYQETLRTPRGFQDLAKDEQCIHVKEQVPEASVHKNVCDYLYGHKLIRLREIKSEYAVEVHTKYTLSCIVSKEHYYIQHNNVLDNRRQSKKASS